MPASPIRKLVPFAETAKKRGIKVHHLNIGQPDIETPASIINAVKEADIKVLAYSHSAGNESYRKKLVTYYEKAGLDITAEEIIVTAGGSEGIIFGMMACMDPGDVSFKAVENENWIGDVNRGGAVNFRDVYFNPHGHGTHTECVGHISKENFTINKCLKEFFFLAQLVTITPQKLHEDEVITLEQVKQLSIRHNVQALVIRTLPNTEAKLTQHYSAKNPPYMQAEAVAFQ